MTKATIEAGICGFTVVAKVSAEDMQHATIRLETACPNLKPLEDKPLEMDAYAECFGKIGDSSVYAYLRDHCRHPGCPVAAGILKAVEVECGLALPKDASMHFEKEKK
jgi:hypothetical protein